MHEYLGFYGLVQGTPEFHLVNVLIQLFEHEQEVHCAAPAEVRCQCPQKNVRRHGLSSRAHTLVYRDGILFPVLCASAFALSAATGIRSAFL